MKQCSEKQYTIRRIPFELDQALRKKAKDENRSLNEVAVEALKAGAGIVGAKSEFHDLDSIAGTWVEDPEFDAAIKTQDRIDRDLWK